MGLIKKWVASATGADVQADIAQRAADEQASAIRASAQKAAAAAQESAAQSTRLQEQAAARAAAESAASDALSKPMENADVQIGSNTAGQSVSAATRKRRQQFGIGSSGSGVSI